MSVKSSSLAMLVLASMLVTADALQCYVCSDKECSASSPKTCSAKEDRCVTRVLESGAVLKSCGTKAFCDVKIPGSKTQCCVEDLCNDTRRAGKMASVFVLP
ncbi:lymphocyte antigen 6C1-like [Engraulis encrasicolus]|uniref:lymphocyte antigen 6C1-like n=1 Tax=Engraulis encrasicolus TaxID=184585 RepID=UPI002FD63737